MHPSLLQTPFSAPSPRKNSRSAHIVINEKEGSEFGVSLELVVEQLNLKTCCECDNLYFCKFLLYSFGNKRFYHLKNGYYTVI